MQSTGSVKLVLNICGRRNGLLIRPCASFFSSKTPVKSNLGLASKAMEHRSPSSSYEVPSSHQVSLVSERKSEVSKERVPTVLANPNFLRPRKEILRMKESELEGYAILQPRLPLTCRRGESSSKHYVLGVFNTEKTSYTDYFSYFHGDWDFRRVALKRWWASVDAEFEIKQQAFNPQRNKVLGNDLAVAHFVVYRKGRIRFKGHTNWITEYRKDAKPGADEADLPVMNFDLCTLPVHYDPRYRVEAIDCKGMPLRYEGLLNFQHLNYVKWLNLRETPLIDDWCLDRLTRIFYDTLEYIDLSGCPSISERGIGALSKCKNLKTLVVENLPHLKHLEMVAALLEDQLSELRVIGIDYASKLEQIRKEGEEIELKLQEEAAKLEANTIDIDPTTAPAPALDEAPPQQQQQRSTN